MGEGESRHAAATRFSGLSR